MGQEGSLFLPALLEALGNLAHLDVVAVMLVGTVIGLVIGFLPGIGALLTLALMLPFTFGMTPFMAFGLLLGMYSASNVASDLTAILFGIPGQPDAAATVLDGYPMAQAGEAGRAMGISVVSSALAGLVGAAVLALSIPVMRPIVLSVGPPESFMLTVLGATIIGTVSGRSALKGMAVAGFGLLLAAVGTNPQTGIYRYTFGLLYLVDGVPIVPIAIGLFAIPEIIGLHRRRSTIARTRSDRDSRALDGFGEVLHHWGALLRSSWIGVAFGMLPGVGGPVGHWAAYGSAKLASKNPQRFGHGAVDGLIAASASNGSKEGGQLVPTLAFGIPGGAAMAVLLGAFLILGLTPGPQMLGSELDVTLFMVIALIFGNVVGAVICFPLLPSMARLTHIRGELLLPFILPLVLVGGMAATGQLGDLVLVIGTGVAAYSMQRSGWPIVPLLVGFVLGEKAETQLALSMNIYDGLGWLARPSVMVITAVIAVVTVFAVRSFRKGRRIPEEGGADEQPRVGSVLIGVALLAMSVWAFVQALGWPAGARVYPQAIAVATALFTVAALVRPALRRLRGGRGQPAPGGAEPGPPEPVAATAGTGSASPATAEPAARATATRPEATVGQAGGLLQPVAAFLRSQTLASALTWILAMALVVWVAGIAVAVGLQVLAYLAIVARMHVAKAAALAVVAVAVLQLVFVGALGVGLPEPLLPL
jgi:TctA family transporter